MLKKPKGSHHHGNLRQALIEAGMQLLQEGGLPALTLRQCAARAGVSPAAPSHHFGGLRGLKSEIAAEGYLIFTRCMREGAAAQGLDPLSQLRGMCVGYVRFASEYNALFNLMFARENQMSKVPKRQKEAIEARAVLTDLSAPFSKSLPREDATQVAVWALAHGFAKLAEIGRVAPGSGDARDISIEDVLPILNLILDNPDP